MVLAPWIRDNLNRFRALLCLILDILVRDYTTARIDVAAGGSGETPVTMSHPPGSLAVLDPATGHLLRLQACPNPNKRTGRTLVCVC